MSLPGLFVVGTDTGVGKTRVAGSIARSMRITGKRVGVLKPVSSGSIPSADAEQLADSLGDGIPLERVAPIVYQEAVAPSIAARRAGTPLTQSHVEETLRETLAWWSDRADVMVVEGIGGFLCPVADDSTVADLTIMLDFPLLIVARRGLGTLNHTLMTVESARLRAVRIAGIVLNSAEPESGDLAEATATGELARRLPGIALLAELRYDSGLDSLDAIDWFHLARPPRT